MKIKSFNEFNESVNDNIDYYDRAACRKIWADLQRAGLRGTAFWDTEGYDGGMMIIAFGHPYRDELYDRFCDICDRLGYDSFMIATCSEVSGPGIERL